MAPDRHFRDIGPRLKRLIEARLGPRQIAGVARRAGLAPAHLNQILTGRRSPRLRTLSDILIAIPAQPRDLFADGG